MLCPVLIEPEWSVTVLYNIINILPEKFISLWFVSQMEGMLITSP